MIVQGKSSTEIELIAGVVESDKYKGVFKQVTGLNLLAGQSIVIPDIENAKQVVVHYHSQNSKYRGSLTLQRGWTDWYYNFNRDESLVIYFRVTSWLAGGSLIISSASTNSPNVAVVGYDLVG